MTSITENTSASIHEEIQPFSDDSPQETCSVENDEDVEDASTSENESINNSCSRENSVVGEKSEDNEVLISGSIKAENEMIPASGMTTPEAGQSPRSTESTSVSATSGSVNAGNEISNACVKLEAVRSPCSTESTSPSATPNCSSTLANDDSCPSEDANFVDLPREMIEEERRFAQQSELEMKQKRVAPLSDIEKDKRYRTLMSLLGKSKEYARYVSRKLMANRESSKETTVKEPQVLQNATNRPSSSRKRRNSNRSEGVASKKRKPNPMNTPMIRKLTTKMP